jgi:hypothetical protein
VLHSSRTETSICLQCEDVSLFRLPDFGGGLTQFLCFQGEDIRADQLQQIRFRFSDLEDDRISFTCSAVTLDAA